MDQNQRWVITFKACPRDPASLHVSEISQPLNIVPQTGDYLFKHMSLWGTFHIQIIIDVPWAYLYSRHTPWPALSRLYLAAP